MLVLEGFVKLIFSDFLQGPATFNVAGLFSVMQYKIKKAGIYE